MNKSDSSPLEITIYLLPEKSAKAKSSAMCKVSITQDHSSKESIEEYKPECIFLVPTYKVAQEISKAGHCYSLIRNKTDAEEMLNCVCSSDEKLAKIFVLVEDGSCHYDTNVLIADSFRKSGVPFIPLDLECIEHAQLKIKPSAARQKNRSALNRIAKFAKQYLAVEKQVFGKLSELGWLPIGDD